MKERMKRLQKVHNIRLGVSPIRDLVIDVVGFVSSSPTNTVSDDQAIELIASCGTTALFEYSL